MLCLQPVCVKPFDGERDKEPKRDKETRREKGEEELFFENVLI